MEALKERNAFFEQKYEEAKVIIGDYEAMI
jgi:hypothetical protein